MTTRARVLLVLTTLVATLGLTAPALAGPAPPSAGSDSPSAGSVSGVSPSQYRIFDMNYQPYPARTSSYYFFANSTPWLRHLKWNGWGSARAVSRGRYVLDCGTCGPTREVYPAKAELKGRVKCSGYFKRFRSYNWMKVTVFYPESEGGTRSRTDPMGCPPADYDPNGF